MTEKETKKLAALANKVARAPKMIVIYEKMIEFNDDDIEFVKKHKNEFIRALNRHPNIKGCAIAESDYEFIDNIEEFGYISFNALH